MIELLTTPPLEDKLSRGVELELLLVRFHWFVDYLLVCLFVVMSLMWSWGRVESWGGKLRWRVGLWWWIVFSFVCLFVCCDVHKEFSFYFRNIAKFFTLSLAVIFYRMDVLRSYLWFVLSQIRAKIFLENILFYQMFGHVSLGISVTQKTVLKSTETLK